MTHSGPYQLVLLRHGESVWNKQNLFTGWRDVKLTAHGEHEAREAGRSMAAAGLTFDVAYTSLLSRAIKTLWLALEEMDSDVAAGNQSIGGLMSGTTASYRVRTNNKPLRNLARSR